MSNAIERIKGIITDINEYGELTIKAKYDNLDRLIKRQYRNVEIELLDSRPLSDNQRKMCWAMINDIADWQGASRSETQRDLVNEARKIDFMVNELNANTDKLFSLSNASVSLIRAYQKYLVHFIISNDIATKKPLYEYVDDISDYVYYCLINKKCAICGRRAELHHIDTVGMGSDRAEIIHEGMECMSLCREHHTLAHTIGTSAFMQKYHFESGINIDKTIARIYKLNGGKR